MSFDDTFNQIVNKSENNKQHNNSEYLDEDGLLHCSVCHKQTQCEVTKPSGDKQVVSCACDCLEKEREAQKEKNRQWEIERRRKNCFAETNMASWTFENDDRKNV